MSIQFDVITKRYPIKIFYMIFIPAKLSEGGKMTKLKGKSDFFFSKKITVFILIVDQCYHYQWLFIVAYVFSKKAIYNQTRKVKKGSCLFFF